MIDTNVLVSALTSPNPDSPPRSILRAWRNRRFRPAYCDALLAEWQHVLARPAIAQRHGLGQHQQMNLFAHLLRPAARLEPAAQAPRAPDPKDQMLWGMLSAHTDLLLVTGDKPLLAAAEFAGRTLRPADFMARIAP